MQVYIFECNNLAFICIVSILLYQVSLTSTLNKMFDYLFELVSPLNHYNTLFKNVTCEGRAFARYVLEIL